MTDSQDKGTEKHGVAEEILTRSSLFVHLDPRAADVDVPAWYQQQAQLVLQVGYDMPVPIPDLCVDEQGVFGTLAFHDHTHFCRVPWCHVFALVDEAGKGRVWPEAFPEEIVTEVHKEMIRRRLRPVEGNGNQDEVSEEEGALNQHLAEVEMDHETAPAQAEQTALRESTAGADEAAPTPGTSPTLASSDTGRRKTRGEKRPLPPYLRVVK